MTRLKGEEPSASGQIGTVHFCLAWFKKRYTLQKIYWLTMV